jgi:dihydroorotase
MTIKISQAQIVDSGNPLNGEVRDIFIENGKISKIGKRINQKADKTISGDGMCVSIGWVDMRANFCDPGFEQKEDLSSGLKAANKGGFTAVAVMPSTNPPADHKSAIKYLLEASGKSNVEVIPVGAVSVGLKGEHLAELYDMLLAGAKAFSDHKHSIGQSGLLQRALLYSSRFNTPIIHFPYDAALVPNAQVNEGVNSTRLGLRGAPSLAEEMMVERDLQILEYSGGKLHLGPISSMRSVDLIEGAKKKGLQVTNEVALANLVFTDDDLEGFDSNFKVLPHLRNSQNLKSLIRAIEKGKIDVISSDHSPEDEEHKKLEFDLAEYGLACIELFFPLLWNKVYKEVEISSLVKCFTSAPLEILGLSVPKIEEGTEANLTIFSLTDSTDTSNFKSASKAYNAVPTREVLKGKVVGTIRKSKVSLNS